GTPVKKDAWPVVIDGAGNRSCDWIGHLYRRWHGYRRTEAGIQLHRECSAARIPHPPFADLRPPGRGSGHRTFIRTGSDRLRVHSVVLCGTCFDDPHRRFSLYLHVCVYGRADCMDYRMGLDPGVRGQQYGGWCRVLGARRRSLRFLRTTSIATVVESRISSHRRGRLRGRVAPWLQLAGIHHRYDSHGGAGAWNQGVRQDQQHDGDSEDRRYPGLRTVRVTLCEAGELASL